MKKLVSLVIVLCLVLAAVPALAGETLQCGCYTFELPANAVVESVVKANEYCSMFTVKGNKYGEQYVVMGVIFEYKKLAADNKEIAEEYDLDDQGVMDYMNYYTLMALAFGEGSMANIPPIKDTTIKMNDGAPVLYGISVLGNGNGLELYSHYYDGNGYLIIGSSAGVAHALVTSGVAQSAKLVRAANTAQSGKQVVITADSGKIRGEASISGSLIKTAYKGETYELIREENDWYIVDVNGRTGYIHKGVAAIQ